MHAQGYSPEQIADAAACGYNPWEWELIPDDELPDEDAKISPELEMVFENIVDNAKLYYEQTGRYLQIWGELGELFAEVKYGIKRHKPHTQGSDGRLGNDFVEIKTISPEKAEDKVLVKRSGNFNKLLVVKINEDFTFEGRFIVRKNMNKGEGTHAQVSWSTLNSDEEQI
jgi:hypothetical protein